MASENGAVPPGVAKKSERLRQGLIARQQLLESALEENWDLDEIRQAGIPPAPSQRNITEWHDPDRGIYRLSLNTAKKHETIFDDITSLLKCLHDRLAKKRAPQNERSTKSSETITALRREIANQKLTISALTSSLVELRALTLMALRELDDDSRLTSFQRQRLHELRRNLHIEREPKGDIKNGE